MVHAYGFDKYVSILYLTMFMTMASIEVPFMSHIYYCDKYLNNLYLTLQMTVISVKVPYIPPCI